MTLKMINGYNLLTNVMNKLPLAYINIFFY